MTRRHACTNSKKVIPKTISKVVLEKACRLTWNARIQPPTPLHHHCANRVVSSHLHRLVRCVEQHTGHAEPSGAFVQQARTLSWTWDRYQNDLLVDDQIRAGCGVTWECIGHCWNTLNDCEVLVGQSRFALRLVTFLPMADSTSKYS